MNISTVILCPNWSCYSSSNFLFSPSLTGNSIIICLCLNKISQSNSSLLTLLLHHNSTHSIFYHLQSQFRLLPKFIMFNCNNQAGLSAVFNLLSVFLLPLYKNINLIMLPTCLKTRDDLPLLKDYIVLDLANNSYLSLYMGHFPMCPLTYSLTSQY